MPIAEVPTEGGAWGKATPDGGGSDASAAAAPTSRVPPPPEVFSARRVGKPSILSLRKI